MDEYKAYTNGLKLTIEQRQILDMIFLKGWCYCRIGEELGYTERAIKDKVKKILDAI